MAFLAPLALAAGAGGATAAVGGSLATALAIGGTVFSGITAFQQAQYQAAIAANNQRTAEASANRASDAAQEEQRRNDLEVAALISQQTGIQSASGLDVLGRSQQLVRRGTALRGREQATDIRRQGEETVRGFQSDAQSFALQRRAAKQAGTNALIETAFNVGGTAFNAFDRKPGNTSYVGAARSTNKTRNRFNGNFG